jgi:hypothetical protein
MKREFLGPGNIAEGMLSDVDQTTLPKGFWGGLFNLRCRGRSLTVRDGSVKMWDTIPVANASCRGAYYMKFHVPGTTTYAEWLIAAFRVGAATRIYYSDGTSAWSELTDATTRFATDGNVTFAPLKTRAGLYVDSAEGVVMQNGVNRPLVWYPYLGTANRINVEANVNTGYSQAYPQQSLALTGNVASWTLTAVTPGCTLTRAVDGGYLVYAYPAAAPGLNPEYAASTTTFTEKLGTATGTFLLTQQFAFLAFNNLSETIMKHCVKVRVRKAAGGTEDIWSSTGVPYSGNMTTIDVPIDATITGYNNCTMYVFDTSDFIGLSIKGFDIVTDGKAATAALEMHVAWVGTGGSMNSPLRFAGSLRNKATFAESPAQAFENRKSVALNAIGGATIATGTNPAVLAYWPINASLATSYVVTFVGSTINTTTHDVIAYSTAPGGPDFGQIAVNGGTYSSPNYRWFFNDSVADFLTAPYDDQAIGMPIGLPMVSFDGRLQIGVGSELYTSAQDDPHYWRKSVIVDATGTVDELSPCYRTIGGEQIGVLQKINGSLYDSNATLILTDQNPYRQNGGGASSISKGLTVLGHRGAKHVNAVAQNDGQIWFLDSEYEIRATSGGTISTAVSLNTIGNRIRNQTMASGSISLPTAFAAFDLFALCYRGVNPVTLAADSLNYEAAIFDTRTGNWQIDRFPFDIAAVVCMEGNGKRKVVAITDAGKIWQLYVQNQTTEDGANLPVYMQSPQICEGWNPVVIKQIGIVTNASGTVTWNTKRFNFPDVAEGRPDGIISLSGTTSGQGWRSDQSTSASAGIPGLSGWSVYFALWGNIPGGAVIRGVRADVEVRGTPGDPQPA